MHRYLPKISRNICQHKASPMKFIANLVIIPPNWKHLKGPSASEWINKLRYNCTVKYCSIIKTKEHTMTWKTLKNICSKEAYVLCDSIAWHSRKYKTNLLGERVQMSDFLGLGMRWDWLQRDTEYFSGWGIVLYVDSNDDF